MKYIVLFVYVLTIDGTYHVSRFLGHEQLLMLDMLVVYCLANIKTIQGHTNKLLPKVSDIFDL